MPLQFCINADPKPRHSEERYKMIFKAIISTSLLLSALLNNFAASKSLGSCSIKLEPIGCYRDNVDDRALREKILPTETSKAEINLFSEAGWNKWRKFLPGFICHCAEIAFKKGYRVIGVQTFGDCFSGAFGHLTFAKHGTTESCVSSKKSMPWRTCSMLDGSCSGEVSTNYVYRIAPTACEIYYEPVGCFADKGVSPRPLPDLSVTERDYNSDKWNGHLINWINWNKYSPEMICRCAKKAKLLGRNVFGTQFYGECWTGDDSNNYAKDGKSDRCLGKDFKPCRYNAYQCVGQDHANSVYLIKTPPQTASNVTEVKE